MEITLLGAKISSKKMQETVSEISSYITKRTINHIITLNAEILYRAQFDRELMDTINQAQLVTPDGAGIVWASRILGTPVPERVTGIDLTLELVKEAHKKGWRIALYGGRPGVAREAANNLQKKYPKLKIVGTYHGYLSSKEEDEFRREIREINPDILFVALGAPKQEFWIRDNKETLGVPVLMGVGGTLDVLAGRAKRAPGWMQQAHLEWLYRLIREPWRYKRMLALPKFAWLVLKTKLGGRDK